MKIVVIGTGGVGGYFGGRLALVGNDVTFIARGQHLKAIQQNGLKVKSIQGEFNIKPARATPDLKAVEYADLVLVCTKAWQVKEVAKKIAPFIGKDTMVLPTQNGVLATEELATFIPAQNIIGGVCRIFSLIESPGVINHKGSNPTIIFGEMDNKKTERAAWLKYTFDMAGFNNIWADDIQLETWKKFLMICSSALLALTKTNYGEMRSLPETRAMLIELYTEIYQLGMAAKINFPEDIVEKTMKAVDQFPYESTSSLTRDVWNGLPSEIKYQNGTVVRLGKNLKVPTPVNQFIYHSILPMELKAEKQFV